MADVTLTYKGSTIAEMSDSGSKTLKTSGKYCEGDIGVSYVKPSGGSGPEIPDSAFVLSGNCSYWDYDGKWDSFITAYADKWSTNNINNVMNMFNGCELTQIPFEINCVNTNMDMMSMFYNCTKLKELPKINNVKVSALNRFVSYCTSLKIIPSDYFNHWDFSYISNASSVYSGDAGYIFYHCIRLRSLPTDWLGNMNKRSYKNYVYFNNGFSNCESLDELTNLPIPYTATYTSDIFSGFVLYCCRLKNLTFASTTEKQWKSQVLSLSANTGWSDTPSKLYFDDSKKVTDDTTYQALKNDPDWWTADVAYSRYNHDSAVATINSLPDTSAYLASAGGTNTIKFKGAAGSATDGGAINTLTEEEIAVATAKGWTISLV